MNKLMIAVASLLIAVPVIAGENPLVITEEENVNFNDNLRKALNSNKKMIKSL